jgi:hypothetical protein
MAQAFLLRGAGPRFACCANELPIPGHARKVILKDCIGRENESAGAHGQQAGGICPDLSTALRQNTAK